MTTIGQNRSQDLIISPYTAEQAVEDGFLVDVSETAKEIGFRWPVRITNTVHNLCTPPKSNKMQSYEGRLWDTLNLARWAIKRMKNSDRMVTYTCKIGRKNYELWAVIDDTSDPAIHVMRPEDY